MIRDNELKEIGKLLKPHGINGEIVMSLNIDVNPEELTCIVLRIDGINVPFYLTGVRPKSNETDLISIDGVETETEAVSLCGHTAYALSAELPLKEISSDGLYADEMVGFTVNANGVHLGFITGIEDSTANYLFIIEKTDGKSCLIPVADEFIENIDPEEQRVDLQVPDALLEL